MTGNNLRNTLYILLSVLVFGCSSGDDDGNQKQIPDSFNIRLEIEGIFRVPEIYISINSIGVQEWNYEDLPFSGEFTYMTSGNELNNSCNCITISAGAFLHESNDVSDFRLYVDDELVDSTNIISQPASDGFLTITRLEYIY